jgi:hypothetical protein
VLHTILITTLSEPELSTRHHHKNKRILLTDRQETQLTSGKRTTISGQLLHQNTGINTCLRYTRAFRYSGSWWGLSVLHLPLHSVSESLLLPLGRANPEHWANELHLYTHLIKLENVEWKFKQRMVEILLHIFLLSLADKSWISGAKYLAVVYWHKCWV